MMSLCPIILVFFISFLPPSSDSFLRTKYHWTYAPASNLLPTVQQGSSYVPSYTEPQHPGCRRLHATATASESQSIALVFGGIVDGSLFRMGDLWEFNGTDFTWRWINTRVSQDSLQQTSGFHGHVSEAYPGSRWGSMVSLKTDGRARLFGGYGFSCDLAQGSFRYLSDVWDFDVSTDEWTYRDLGSPGTENLNDHADKLTGDPIYPGGRYLPAVWPVGDDIVICGGAVQLYTFRFHDLTNNWTVLADHASGPFDSLSVYPAATWTSPDEATLFFFGETGDDPDQARMIASFDVPASMWTWRRYATDGIPTGSPGQPDPSLGETYPGGRSLTNVELASVTSDGLVILTGGEGAWVGMLGSDQGFIADVWLYSVSTDVWTWVPITQDGDELQKNADGRFSGQDPYPEARENVGLFRMGRRVFMYGGLSSSGFMGDVWYVDIPEEDAICNQTETTCSGHGNCTYYSPFCECDAGYFGPECEDYMCVDQNWVNETDSACSGHGTCDRPNGTCVCRHQQYWTMPFCAECVEGYALPFCNTTVPVYICGDGHASNSTEVCTGHGTCSFPLGPCICEEYWYTPESLCNTTMHPCIDGEWTNDTEAVCGGHGTCAAPNADCFCDPLPGEIWIPPYCATNVFICSDGYLSNNTAYVCSGHGTCNAPFGVCGCHPDWDPPLCDAEVFLCADGELSNDTGVVCSGHGTCSEALGPCICETYWLTSSSFCNTTAFPCLDGEWTNSTTVCSSHGTCTSPYDDCVCVAAPGEIWIPPYCNTSIFICEDGNLANNTRNVCSGHGSCDNPGGPCICIGSEWLPPVCSVYYCEDGRLSNSSTVCSEHGNCLLPGGACVCDLWWDPPDCDSLVFVCADDRLSNESDVCSGHGNCLQSDPACLCRSGWGGEYCDDDGSTVDVAPIIGAVAGAIVALVVIAAAVIVVVVVAVAVNRARRKTTSEIEARLADEAETPGAKIRIDEKLFEIDFESIELQKLLGSGGSGASIFLADWKGKAVAIKTFRSSVFVGQENFNDFEKEVAILASVSHPVWISSIFLADETSRQNILQFYGCTLKLPRIGIVMEYCSNGDLLAFLGRRKADGDPASILLKMTILEQVCGGMEFLHDRSIIHRDLKVENILINDTLEPKIIDFGLSRFMGDQKQRMTGSVGTSIFMAPEVTLGLPYNGSCDVFSFGIMAFEVIFHNFSPYGKDVDFSIETRVATDETFRPKIRPKKVKALGVAWVVPVLQKCWLADMDCRPTFAELRGLFRDGRMKEIAESSDSSDE